MVRQIEVFSGLSEAAVGELARIVVLRRCRRGALAFLADEPTQEIAFVLNGTVRMFRDASGGHEQTLQVVHDGGALNLVGLLPDAGYPATAEAVTDCDLAVVRRADFLPLVQRHGDLAWALAQQLAGRLRAAQSRIFDFGLRSAAGRIGSVLLELARIQGQRLPDGSYVLAGPVNHRELSQMVGISRETATRTLRRLREGDAVRRTDDGCVVVDPRALAPWLDAAGER